MTNLGRSKMKQTLKKNVKLAYMYNFQRFPVQNLGYNEHRSRGWTVGIFLCKHISKNIQWRLNPFNLSGYASAMIPMIMALKKFCPQFDQPCATLLLLLTCKRGMGLSSVSTALSSNIPTFLLVDCCYESVQQCFSCSYFSMALVP